MHIKFVDIASDVICSLRDQFGDINNDNQFSFHVDSITKSPQGDAIISPANSFGWLNGGVDAAYAKRWTFLQRRIHDELKGDEILVGSARLFDLSSDVSHFILAPTMRTPSDISNTVNVYLAFKAAIKLAIANKLETILCPGMGTGTGGMSPEIAALQMFWGYQDAVAPKNSVPSFLETVRFENFLKGYAV